MSGNISLANRRRRNHAAFTGGRSRPSSVITVEKTLPLPVAEAAARARHAIHDATGISFGADEDGGAAELGMFGELVVDLDVDARGAESDVRIALRTERRNGALAIFLLALAVLSVVGIVGYALATRGDRGPRARLQKMAKRIEASLADGRAFGNPSLSR
jgi:hypothetical protein